jgi:hypothetical protein
MVANQAAIQDPEGLAGVMAIEVASGRTRAESQIRDEELYRMAAFRIRETANRIAKLANGAHDPALRSELTGVCERLLSEERALLALTTKS